MKQKKEYYVFNELTSTSIYMKRKVPPFGLIIVILVSSLLLGLITWALLVKKTSVVKTTGLLTNVNKVNIMNQVSGRVEKIHVNEGEKVKKDDILITLFSDDLNMQIEQLKENKRYYEEKIYSIEKTIDFINDYSVDDEFTQKNPFEREDIKNYYYFSLCESFIDYAQSTKEDGEGNQVAYTQGEIDAVKFSLLEQYNICSSYDSVNRELISINAQINAYEKTSKNLIILATTDGYVHFNHGLVEGTYLSNSSLLATISNNIKDDYYFEIIILSKDRSKIEIGNEVEISIDGVSQTNYGVIKGRLESISSDVQTSQDGNQIYYIGKVKPNQTCLQDKNNNQIDIVLGMIGECRIKYNESNYMTYFIEQLGAKLLWQN